MSLRGKCVIVSARNPATVAVPEALMVCALLAMGVPQHPQLPFQILHLEENGAPIVLWRWTLKDKTKNGLYETEQLIKWWRDPAWFERNPQHEFAIVRHGLLWFAEHAKAVRASTPRAVIRHGLLEAHIPITLPADHREHIIGQLHGKIPKSVPYKSSPATQAA